MTVERATPVVGAASVKALPEVTVVRSEPDLSMAQLFALVSTPAAPRRAKRSPAAEIRLSQARELLGRHYQRSVVKVGERIDQVDPFIEEWTARGLSQLSRKKARRVAKVIIDESLKYQFDPVFLVAVIQNESSFNPLARGTSGEIGLMQILPETAEWVAKKNNLRWKGAESLKDPITNIRIGAAYLAQLRESFDSHARLYLSAYNMGSRNVHRALDRSVWPKEYAGRVMSRYIALYTEIKERRLQMQDRQLASFSGSNRAKLR